MAVEALGDAGDNDGGGSGVGLLTDSQCRAVLVTGVVFGAPGDDQPGEEAGDDG